MSDITSIAETLRRVGVPTCVLEDDRGDRALVCAYGSRVLAWQPPGATGSLLWAHPGLGSVRSVDEINALKGGPGGLRVWFSPEWAYFWDGPPDALRFSNHTTQRAAAEGRWSLQERSRRCVTATTRDEILDLSRRERVSFTVERTIGLFDTPPDEVRGAAVVFSGLSVLQRLELVEPSPETQLDLWNLLQVSTGSRMLFPVRRGRAPEVYYNASGKRSWREHEDLVEWPVSGDSEAKLGLSASEITGRVGALVPENRERATLLVWNHPVLPGLPYPDGPRKHFDRDQVVQSWDGFGFGEIEYHSPAADCNLPVVLDASVLWAFTGPPGELREIALQLLGRDVATGP
jgi:hypothetical protein